MKSTPLFFLLSFFLQAGTFTFNSFTLTNHKNPPLSLLGIFSDQNKDVKEFNKIYLKFSKNFNLTTTIDNIHSEAFFEALLFGLIDRAKINELTKESLLKMTDELAKKKVNARFSATFFHSRRIALDFHDQAEFITKKNNTGFNYVSLNNYITNMKLLDKYFSELTIIDKNYYAYAFTFKTYLLKKYGSKIHTNIINEFKDQRQKTNFENFLASYELCENYWYKSVAKIFYDEKFIFKNDKLISTLDLINELWNGILNQKPNIEQIKMPAIFSIANFSLPTSFYDALIIPTNNIFTDHWQKSSLFRKQQIFNESLKLWDSVFPTPNQYKALENYSQHSNYSFKHRHDTISHGFALPTFALLVDTIYSLNRLAFKKNLTKNFNIKESTISIEHDEFWETGVAIFFTEIVINKFKKLHPIIEYWFLVKVHEANNLEKYIFAKKILEALGEKKIIYLKDIPTIQALFENKKISDIIFKFYKITNPVFTPPQSISTKWEQFNGVRRGNKINIISKKTGDQKETQDESINTKGI